MRRIFSSVKLKVGQFAGLLVLILLSAVGQMLLPAFLSNMIGEGVATGQTDAIWFYGAIMAGVTVFSCVISFLSVKTASHISTDFAFQLREKVFAKVQSFSTAEMDRFGTASLITRSTSDITNVQNFLTLMLRVGLLAPMMAVAGLVFSASTGGEVSSVLLVAIPVLLVVLTVIMVLASRYSIRLRQKLDHINGLFLETLEGVRVIRAFNKQQTECARFEQGNRDYAMTAMTAGRITSLLMPAISVIFGVTTAAVLGMGAHYVQTGAMEVGSLVANSQYISMVLTSVVTQVTTAVGVLIMMFAISPKLSIIPIVMVPLSLLSAAGVMKASEKYYAQQQDLLGKVNGYVEEMYNGQSVVQAFNYQRRAEQGIAKLNKALMTSSRKAETTAGAVSPITTLVNDLGYVLCAGIGCLWAIAGRITVGNVQAMLEYTWRFAEPFSAIAGMVGSFSAAAAAGERIFTLLDAKEELPNRKACVIPRERKGAVTFRNVQFGYTPDHLLMKGIDLTVQPGQKVAIVGPTGAGKITLINLLMRFYELNGGTITVDGVSTTDMPRQELRDRFGMVLQDTWLYEGTIAENIGYADEHMD